MRKLAKRFLRSPTYTLETFGVLLCAMIVVLFLVDLRSRYQGAIQQAKNEALNHAEILADNTAVTFETVDRVLRESELIRRSSLSESHVTSEAANAALRHLTQTSPLVVAIGWTDAAGDLLAHSYNENPPRINIAEMSHFTAQRDGDVTGLLITEPFHSAAGDKWFIAASRRLSDAEGHFAGVVTAALDPSYFNRTYRSFNLGNGGAILLMHRSGQLIAREPVVRLAIGTSLAGGPLFNEFLPASNTGAYELANATDGSERIAGYKVVPGLPLVLLVSYSRTEVLKPWYQHLRLFGSLLVLVVASIMAGTFVLVAQAGHLAAKTASLEQKSAVVEQTNSWFDAALTNMSNGISMFDADGNLVVWNEQYVELYGMSSDLIQRGVSIHTIVEHRKLAGNLDVDVKSYIGEFRQALVDVGRSTSTSRLADGRTVSVVNTAIAGGGWVGIHEDITERLSHEASIFGQATELARVNMRFDAALSNMTQGLCLFDSDKRLVIANSRFREMYDLPEELLKPGTPLPQILKVHANRGAKSDLTVEGYSEQILDQSVKPLHLRMVA